MSRPHGSRNMAEWHRTTPTGPDYYRRITDKFWVGLKRTGGVWIAVTDPALFPKESNVNAE